MFYIKKISIILISVILCISLFGCSHNSTEVQVPIATTTTAANESTSENITTAEAKGSTKKRESTTIKETKATTTDKATTTATTENGKTTTKSSATTSKPTVTATEKKQTTKKQTTAKATTKKQTTSTTRATINCTIKIECSSILSNKDKLKAGHEAYVPSNGIILSTVSVSAKNGATVYDVLKSACDSNGINLNVVNSGYGKYIAGINYIDEKDCGKYSGWTYTVNGAFINKSADKCVLKSGDSIVFSYTCGNN